ncbi:MAG: BMP family ABC transporter substrate-binding protein [Desulfovibrionaceae bacterium]|nr:BMP family ABC transporter substrate-binding protein [Desulfovibrionaceae bacterium]
MLLRWFLGLVWIVSILMTCNICAYATQQLKVTLLLEHDAPSTWSTLLKQGLLQAERKFSIKAQLVICADPSKQEAVFKAVAQNADLVLVATERFQEILRTQAANYPQTRFGVIDANIRRQNVTCITFADEQAAFLAGAAAALFAKAHLKPNQEPTIGWLSGADIAAMRSMFSSFQEGAQLSVPGIRVIHGVATSFNNQALAASETNRLLKQGVQVLVLAAGAGNAQALELAKQAQIYVIGLDSDQRKIYPQHVLLSIIKQVDTAVYTLIAATVSGKFPAQEIVVYDLKDGVAVTDPTQSLGIKDPVLTQISRRIKELTQEILQGGIKIKSLRARTFCNCL